MSSEVPRGLLIRETVRKCGAALLREACIVTRDIQLAEDAVQEALLGAWKAQSSGADVRFERQWLLQAVRNAARRIKMRADRMRKPPKDLAVVLGNSALMNRPEVKLANAELTRLAEKAIGELPEDLRTVSAMRFKRGMSVDEIVCRTGVSKSTVVARLRGANKRIIQTLKRLR